MTEQQMISFVPLQGENLQRSTQFFVERLRPTSSDIDWLHYGVKEGVYQTTQVNFNNVPALAFFYSRTCDGGLVINAASSLKPKEQLPVELIDTAAVILAKQNNCHYVEFETIRVAMVAYGKRFGYVPNGIVMRKVIRG